MKKRLLLCLVAFCTAVAGFALGQGEYVYTPQGRFLISGDNVASSTFADFTGWTVISATEGKALEDIFNINGGGYADGLNSVSSIDATVGEGMYFKFEPADAGATYVVSFKAKSSALMSVRTRTIVADGNNPSNDVAVNNVVRFAGNSAHTYGAADDEVVVNTAEELTEDWQTFNYAIVGDGTSRTYFLAFTGIPATMEIADLQIAPAVQYADLRQRDAMVAKLEAYKNVYPWSAAALGDGFDENLDNLKAIGDESSQEDLNDQLETCKDVLDEFVKANMDDYLAGSAYNYLGIGTTKMQKVTAFGDWSCVDRGFWSVGDYPDLGHYQSGNTWSNGNPGNAMGVTIQKDLAAGSYVYAIEGRASLREAGVSKTWINDDGMKPAYGVAYIVKIVDGAAADTVMSVIQDLEPLNFTQFLLPVKIEADGTYEFGFKAYCKEAYKSIKYGSVTYVKDAAIWGKNENKYNQKQLTYEANVRAQITAGRTNLTTAEGYLASAEYLWGKAELQACVDTIASKIAGYEAMDQDAIIATYDEDTYVAGATNENALLEHEVYVEAVKDIIAANKRFVAVNDTLNSIQVAIDNAEATMNLRVYDAATGKDALTAAINTAKELQAQMKATQYSEENAAAIKAGNAALSEAVETFKTTVPASAITTVVDIDFESDAVLNDETAKYSITGAAGTMEFSHFSTTAPESGDCPFQQGHWDNGEQKWKGYLRVGNGTGTVTFDPATTDGTMGTNILKVSCDFYFQGLSKRSIGFYLKDAEGNNVSGFYRNYYDGSSSYDPFGADASKAWAKSGGSYNDASPADVEDKTANPLEKTHFEVIMDYGRQSMYCNISSINGSTTSNEVALAGIPTQFVIQCDYDNQFATRRCWFDNLKIERIAAGPCEPFVDGIRDVNAYVQQKAAPIKVLKDGRIVINGKYGINGIIVK